MFSSPYFPHALYSLACLSISMNLLGMRRTASEDKSRVEARISILESLKDRLTNDPELDSNEVSRLLRLANKPTEVEKSGRVLGDDVSWSDIFSRNAPKVGKEEMSRWEKEDLEELRKEMK